MITKGYDAITRAEICGYCNSKPELVDSIIIYGKSFGNIWLCKCCFAYVGVHKGTNIALGRLSDSSARALKKRAHLLFDSIWKDGLMSRKDAYKWLSKCLNIPYEHCHIAMMDNELLEKTIDLCNNYLKSNLLDDASL